MVNIAMCKLDKRGRMSIPLSFLKANGILNDDESENGTWFAVIKPKMNTFKEVTIEFVTDGDVIHGEGSSKDAYK